jgi:hypothetical protein
MAMDFGVLPPEILALSPTDLGLTIVAWRAARLSRARQAAKCEAMPVYIVG